MASDAETVDSAQARDMREKRQRRALLLLILLAGLECDELAARVSAGMTPEEFGRTFYGQLRAWHSQAAIIGSLMAPAGQQFIDSGRLGEIIADGEAGYLRAFMQDLAAGRYTREDGTVDEARVARRARMYLAKLVGTANRAYVALLDPATLIYWRTDEEAQHCNDCPKRAQGGPYTPLTLPGYPGDGSTRCLYQCRCWLETADGKLLGFRITDPGEGDTDNG